MKYVKTYESFTDSKFLERKEELIDYMTGTGPYETVDFSKIDKLGFKMTSKEPVFTTVEIPGIGKIDTEMMEFKKDDFIINSGVCYDSDRQVVTNLRRIDMQYVTTVKTTNGKVVVEPFISGNIEELNHELKINRALEKDFPGLRMPGHRY